MSVLYSKEYRPLNPNLGDWGILYIKARSKKMKRKCNYLDGFVGLLQGDACISHITVDMHWSSRVQLSWWSTDLGGISCVPVHGIVSKRAQAVATPGLQGNHAGDRCGSLAAGCSHISAC